MEEVEEDVYEVQGEVLEVTSAGDAEENVVQVTSPLNLQ